MKLLFIALTAYVALALTEQEYWVRWKKFLGFSDVQKRTNMYPSKAEHDKRFEIFKGNMDKAEAHNKGNHSWTMGITQFADMTSEEFKAYVACGSLKHTKSESVFVAPKDWNKTGASSIDWVAQGAVTPVKNQGSCGSCWSFSATGAIEGRYKIAKGQLNSLSEQDLVDCSKKNNGCNGGVMNYAFEYVAGRGGLCSEADYPYVGYQHYYCAESQCSLIDPITSYGSVMTVSTSALEAACSYGPVAIAIEADQNSFQLYRGGVLTGSCGTNLDHGVLLVGYGTDGSNDYWKVKNSWGANWGEAGYIRLCRNCNANAGRGQCGILLSASFPIV